MKMGSIRGFLAADVACAIAVIALCTSLALAQVRSAGTGAAQLLETATLERKAIGIADWIVKHCEGENGISKCEDISGAKTRAANVASAESFEKMRGNAGGLRDFFGIGEGETLGITLERIGGGNSGTIGTGEGGACASRLLLLAGENFSFSELGGNAGLEEAVLRVCVGGKSK